MPGRSGGSGLLVPGSLWSRRRGGCHVPTARVCSEPQPAWGRAMARETPRQCQVSGTSRGGM